MYPGPTSSCSIHTIGSTVGRLALAWSKVPTKWWFKHVSRGLGCDFRSCPRQPHAGFAHLRLQRSLERSLAGKGNPSAYPTSFAATPARPVMLSGHGICSCLACSSAPTHSASASRHSNASCSASRYASRNLTPFPSSSLETSRRFLSKEVCRKVMGTPTKWVSVSFLHKCGPRRSHCSAVSCSCQPR